MLAFIGTFLLADYTAPTATVITERSDVITEHGLGACWKRA